MKLGPTFTTPSCGSIPETPSSERSAVLAEGEDQRVGRKLLDGRLSELGLEVRSPRRRLAGSFPQRAFGVMRRMAATPTSTLASCPLLIGAPEF